MARHFQFSAISSMTGRLVRRPSLIPDPNRPAHPGASRKPASLSSNSSSIFSTPISSGSSSPSSSIPSSWVGMRRASTPLQDPEELMEIDPPEPPEELGEPMEVD